MTPRPRLTAGRLAALVEHLSERDLSIVITLARVRMASARQLERLHFDGPNPVTAARRCRRTLERLVSVGLLARLERRIGGERAGSAGFVYALGLAGQRLAGGVGPAGRGRVRRVWTPSFPFLAHLLAVTELYVQLVEADRAGRLELLDFATEPHCWRRFTGAGGEVVTLKPDAIVRTALGRYEDSRFVEVDRGSESPATLARKLDVYRAYWSSGREQAAHDVFPGVLVLVPDDRRLQVVVDVAARQPAQAWPLFQVARFDQAMEVFAGGQP